MRARDVAYAAVLLAHVPVVARAQRFDEPLLFAKLASECAPDVHPTTLRGLVSTESSWNPYAIGVVGGHLDRQPRTIAEAVAIARSLTRKGLNFSMGYGQVNRYNLPKYGETYETAFEPCRNLKASSAILKDCYQRAKKQIGDDQQALRAALSCYYSGNFKRGFQPDKAGQPSYVQKVVLNAVGGPRPIPLVPAIQPQDADDGVPIQTRSSAPVRWVILTDEAQTGQNVPLARQAAAENAAVTFPRVTPRSEAASAAIIARPTEDAPRRVAPVSVRREAPFVQFAN
ncbi:MAG: Transglycosylase domain [Herminiimonas sp.]|nr:Transglycosylase domain [Herminiimonas sp.]